jgi:hypothetical protein
MGEQALSPVDLNGFYKVTGDQEITFWVTSGWPNQPVGLGWTASGVTGLSGNIQVTSASQVWGVADDERFNWKFTLQSDTNQFIEGVHRATGVILYPPSITSNLVRRISSPIYGYYRVVNNELTFYFTTAPPAQTGIGWIVEGLPTVSAPLELASYAPRRRPGAVWRDRRAVSTAVLRPVDNSIPENNYDPVFVNGLPALIHTPYFAQTFVPGYFRRIQVVDPNKLIRINPQIHGGRTIPLRDLDTRIQKVTRPPEYYDEIKSRGFSTGSILGLYATGPQEDYLLAEDLTKSQWNPAFKQHTNSVMYQRVIPFPPPNPSYQGQTIQIELLPTELGHLLSNMYLKVTLPALATGNVYSENVGRALIKQVDLLVNETVIETLYDDWYIIRDQVFLDADEQLGMFSAVGGFNMDSQKSNDVVIPLEFFFCRRHTHGTKGRERLARPFFPLCAMWNQRLYVRFTFHPNTWWCDVPVPHSTDIYSNGIFPKLITEEILLDPAEKLYYQNTPLKYIVNRVKKESTLPFSSGNPQLQLTASFPVQTIAWFFRNRKYEQTDTGTYSDSRYDYGYTTKYIQASVPLYFPSNDFQSTQYVDVIQNAKITLNNVDILSTFQGSLYYTFKQPMEHGLSIPSKNIYMYSFGLTPKEYNQGGYLNFSKLNSQTTTLTMTFDPVYATQITQGYNLYLFYYGYTLLEFDRGFARLPFV